MSGLFGKKAPSLAKEKDGKSAKLEAAAAMKADFKRLNLDERLSVMF